MKIIRIILIVLVVIVALFLVVAAFLPSNYRVERSTEIAKPVGVVFGVAVDYNHRLKWDPWMEKDSTAESTINVIEGFVGSTWEWDGEWVGTGKLTIEEIVENKSIRSKLVFLTPQTMESSVDWKFEPITEGTKVTWGNDGTLDYPVGRYIGLLMDRMMGADFEKGLANLKKLSEEMEEETTE